MFPTAMFCCIFNFLSTSLRLCLSFVLLRLGNGGGLGGERMDPSTQMLPHKPSPPFLSCFMLIQVIGSLGNSPGVHCLIFVDALPLFPLSPSPSDLHVVVPLNGHELERMKLDRVLIHEDFDCTNLNNDVALLLLASPVEFGEERTPICLPLLQDLGAWQDCWAATWRSTTPGIAFSSLGLSQKCSPEFAARTHTLAAVNRSRWGV